MEILKTVSIFVLAGLCEIGGGYLVWQSLREEKSIWHGLFGCIVLCFYGIVATWQPAGFAKVYATYGGFFIIMSMLWAIKFDNYSPDRYDITGCIVALIGVFIIYYGKR